VAYSERFGVSEGVVNKVGTLQLCRCKTDEARRILLRAQQAEVAAAKVANAAMNEHRRLEQKASAA